MPFIHSPPLQTQTRAPQQIYDLPGTPPPRRTAPRHWDCASNGMHTHANITRARGARAMPQDRHVLPSPTPAKAGRGEAACRPA